MAARVVTQANAHTFGVLDPAMSERRDTKFLQSSLSAAENVIVIPQGGYVDRGGSTHQQECRRELLSVHIALSELTAPNGGSLNLIRDGDPDTLFTTNAVDADPFVVVEIFHSTVPDTVAVDLENFSAATSTRDDCLEVQYWDGAAWQTFGNAVNIRTAARTRRFALSPEAGATSRQRWRVVVTGGAGLGAISIGSLTFWRETSTAMKPRNFPFNRTVDERFVLVFTAGNIDVYRDGVFTAAVPSPVTEDMLMRLKPQKKDDSILLFHNDLEPQNVAWQGADDEWNISAVPFTNIPRYDFGDVVYTNGVTEKQEIALYDVSNGDKFELELEGDKTAAIDYSTTPATTAANIAAALEELAIVEAGLTVTSSSATVYQVEFTGGSNVDRDWLQMGGLALNTAGFISIRTLVKGKAGGEAPFSASRGWPSFGRFAFGRLVMGGFKGVPNGWIASVVGDVFDLNIELGGAAAAMFNLIDDDDTAALHDVRVGRTLLFFTENGVRHLRQEQFSAENVPEMLHSDAPGIEPHLPPLSTDNAIFYIQRGGQVMRQLTYSELEGNYIADNASVLSSFLIDKPVSWTLRRAVAGNDGDVIMIADEQGRLVTITLMRAQDVSGFAPHVTDGKWCDLAVDAESVTWQLMERTRFGTSRYVLEKMEPDEAGGHDGCIVYQVPATTTQLDGLEAYEGVERVVWADQHYVGKFTVTNGKITLPYAVTNARVGSWCPPLALDHPLVLDEETGRPEARRIRCFTVYLSVYDTTSVALVVNGGEMFDVPFEFWDLTPMDSPRGARPYTGTLPMEGFPGFSPTGQLLVTQAIPGKLKLRQAKKEMIA